MTVVGLPMTDGECGTTLTAQAYRAQPEPDDQSIGPGSSVVEEQAWPKGNA
jgi:hypothetical protein